MTALVKKICSDFPLCSLVPILHSAPWKMGAFRLSSLAWRTVINLDHMVMEEERHDVTAYTSRKTLISISKFSHAHSCLLVLHWCLSTHFWHIKRGSLHPILYTICITLIKWKSEGHCLKWESIEITTCSKVELLLLSYQRIYWSSNLYDLDPSVASHTEIHLSSVVGRKVDTDLLWCMQKVLHRHAQACAVRRLF